jgi:uncharacterized protein YndB with AHSA1/START domain
MNTRPPYTPDAAYGAEVTKEGPRWTLALVRTYQHPIERVWEAITDPAHLREWSPFDASANLGATGAKAALTTVGAPSPTTEETVVTRAEAPTLLEYQWGGHPMRWELEPMGSGTRLKLWTSIPKNFIAMGAAGWHICLDVMDRHLAGAPIGRMVGMDALKFEGWHRLNAEYARQFGIESVVPKW